MKRRSRRFASSILGVWYKQRAKRMRCETARRLLGDEQITFRVCVIEEDGSAVSSPREFTTLVSAADHARKIHMMDPRVKTQVRDSDDVLLQQFP